MTCDRRRTVSTSTNPFQSTSQSRSRLFSTPEKQDLETIYENEANAASNNIESIGVNRLRLSNSVETDSTNKKSRIPASFSPRAYTNDSKTTNPLTNAVGVLSPVSANSNGDHAANDDQRNIGGTEQKRIVAALAQHTNTATPVAAAVSPAKRSPVNSTSSAASTVPVSSSSAKQFFTRRVRSQSKTDSQPVSDKSLFSKLFPKKSKKPNAQLLTTTTKSIDLDTKKKRPPLLNQSSLSPTDAQLRIDEEEEQRDNNQFDDELDKNNISTASFSDNEDEHPSHKDMMKNVQGTKSGRTASGNSKTSSNNPTTTTIIPASDSQYYASLSAAPKGFSISYHKCMTKGNDNLRKQAALGLFQQNKQTSGIANNGANQLMSLFQDPQRTENTVSTMMSSTTRVKTYSGQTIVTRNPSNDRSSSCHMRSSSMSPTLDADEIFISDDEIYTHFMKSHTCYDIMPKSSKLVVFDTQLAVKKAFFALVYNGVRAASLWDTKRQKFVGMLTITDFILILQKYYKEPNAKIEELEEHKIATWRDVLKEYERPMLSIRPNDSLFEAIRILIDNHVHRLPIIDPVSNNVIFILTHKRILRFFHLYISDWPKPSFMSKTLEELKLGTYEKMHVIEEGTTIIEALNIFVKYRVSALPVVDENRKLVNVYSKFDVIGLAADKTYRNLNMTISEALSYRKDRSEGVAKCYKHETLSSCMERIVKAEVHRLVVVDNDEHVIGVLSLSDLLNYIVIRPSRSTSLPCSPIADEIFEEKE